MRHSREETKRSNEGRKRFHRTIASKKPNSVFLLRRRKEMSVCFSAWLSRSVGRSFLLSFVSFASNMCVLFFVRMRSTDDEFVKTATTTSKSVIERARPTDALHLKGNGANCPPRNKSITSYSVRSFSLLTTNPLSGTNSNKLRLLMTWRTIKAVV